MPDWNEFHKICQQELRKEYRAYRKAVQDPFFVGSSNQAKRRLTEMLKRVRENVESRYPVYKKDLYKRDDILTEYLILGRKHGLRYGRQKGIIMDENND